MRSDWHPEDVKAEIRKTGVTLSALSSRLGYCDAAVRIMLKRPWPKLEALVAKHLDRKPFDIWPSRYNAHGVPLKHAVQPSRSRRRAVAHRKSGEAA